MSKQGETSFNNVEISSPFRKKCGDIHHGVLLLPFYFCQRYISKSCLGPTRHGGSFSPTGVEGDRGRKDQSPVHAVRKLACRGSVWMACGQGMDFTIRHPGHVPRLHSAGYWHSGELLGRQCSLFLCAIHLFINLNSQRLHEHHQVDFETNNACLR
jgi:hypothetical protein